MKKKNWAFGMGFGFHTKCFWVLGMKGFIGMVLVRFLMLDLHNTILQVYIAN